MGKCPDNSAENIIGARIPTRAECDTIIVNENIVISWPEELHINKIIMGGGGAELTFPPTQNNRDIYVDELTFIEPDNTVNNPNRLLEVEKIIIEYLENPVEIDTSEFVNIKDISCNEHSIKITGSTWGFDDFTTLNHETTINF